jgi:hypothetical protein
VWCRQGSSEAAIEPNRGHALGHAHDLMNTRLKALEAKSAEDGLGCGISHPFDASRTRTNVLEQDSTSIAGSIPVSVG